MKINYDLIKEKTLQDYQRNLDKTINELKVLEKYDQTGLLVRILNYDRQELFGCCGKVINTSQCSVIQNRSELSFLKSILHLFNYYLYDDGFLTIKWERYDINKGECVPCKKTHKRAKPYLDYMNDEIGTEEIVGAKEILWLLDYIEDKHNKWIKSIIEMEKDYKGMKTNVEKEFIDYFI